ncbi:MAG TPA: CDP-archaeol synthase [Kofleriaceae bacterium]|nr:CDP-archaeol synthase [Kofleriaceae bacterium]
MRILQAAYLFAPLLVASGLSGIVLRLSAWERLRRPIDAGRSWRGHRLFGDNKTWRGIVVAVVGCTIGVAIQMAIGHRVGRVALVDYREPSTIALGMVMGLGATLGELPNSFVKRQLGIAPGKTAGGWTRVLFYIWDQVDLVIGAWPLVALWVAPDLVLVVASVGLVLALHPVVSVIGYIIGARRSAR